MWEIERPSVMKVSKYMQEMDLQDRLYLLYIMNAQKINLSLKKQSYYFLLHSLNFLR